MFIKIMNLDVFNEEAENYLNVEQIEKVGMGGDKVYITMNSGRSYRARMSKEEVLKTFRGHIEG